MSTMETAYHEAGHAVASFVLGFVPQLVTILPNEAEGSLGAQQDLYDDDTRQVQDTAGGTFWEPIPRAYKARAVVLYAGRAAEAILTGERDARQAFRGTRGDRSDRHKAVERIAALWAGPGQRRRRARRYQRLAFWLVRRHWSRVVLVAEALLDYKTLGFDEIGILLEDEGGRAAMDQFRTFNIRRT